MADEAENKQESIRHAARRRVARFFSLSVLLLVLIAMVSIAIANLNPEIEADAWPKSILLFVLDGGKFWGTAAALLPALISAVIGLYVNSEEVDWIFYFSASLLIILIAASFIIIFQLYSPKDPAIVRYSLRCCEHLSHLPPEKFEEEILSFRGDSKIILSSITVWFVTMLAGLLGLKGLLGRKVSDLFSTIKNLFGPI